MSTSRNPRRTFSSEQKAAILRRHLVDKVPVSNLCDEYQIQPSLFYGWQRQLMDNLALAVGWSVAGRSRNVGPVRPSWRGVSRRSKLGWRKKIR